MKSTPMKALQNRYLPAVIGLMLLLCGNVNAQVYQKLPNRYEYRSVWVDSTFRIPFGLTPKLNESINTTVPGALFYKTDDSTSIYAYSGYQFLRVGSNDTAYRRNDTIIYKKNGVEYNLGTYLTKNAADLVYAALNSDVQFKRVRITGKLTSDSVHQWASFSNNPTGQSNATVWYNSTANKFYAVGAGAARAFVQEGDTTGTSNWIFNQLSAIQTPSNFNVGTGSMTMGLFGRNGAAYQSAPNGPSTGNQAAGIGHTLNIGHNTGYSWIQNWFSEPLAINPSQLNPVMIASGSIWNGGLYQKLQLGGGVRIQGTFNPNSTADYFAGIDVVETYNQTGGTGNVYGLKYTPTVTSLTGKNYTIYSTSGDIVHTLFKSGSTAPSTSGITKPIVTDTSGKWSFGDWPGEYVETTNGNYTISAANGKVQNIIHESTSAALFTLPDPSTTLGLALYIKNNTSNVITFSRDIHLSNTSYMAAGTPAGLGSWKLVAGGGKWFYFKLD